MFTWMRHWPRHALAAFAATLAVLAFGAWRTWALINAQPHPTVDTIAQLNALALEGQPEGENAWDAYVAAYDEAFPNADALPREQQPNGFMRRSEIYRGAWEDTDRTPLIEWLDEHRALLDRVDEISQLERFVPVFKHGATTAPDGREFASLVLVRSSDQIDWRAIDTLQNLNISQMRVSAEAGDWDDVAARMRTGLRIAIQRSKWPRSMDLLRMISSYALMRSAVSFILNEYDVPTPACQAMLDALDAWDVDMDLVLRRVGEATSIEYVDAIQWLHTSSGVPLLTEWDNEFNSLPMSIRILIERPLRPWAPGDAHARDVAQRYIAHFERTLTLTHKDFQANHHMYRGHKHHKALMVVGMTAAAGMKTIRALESFHAALRVMLRLEMYFNEMGHWPDSLLDAMSEAEARDPFSGEMFEYELAPNDQSGRPYELRIGWYSSARDANVVNRPRQPLQMQPARRFNPN